MISEQCGISTNATDYYNADGMYVGMGVSRGIMISSTPNASYSYSKTPGKEASLGLGPSIEVGGSESHN